jgi:hypothetical protein
MARAALENGMGCFVSDPRWCGFNQFLGSEMRVFAVHSRASYITASDLLRVPSTRHSLQDRRPVAMGMFIALFSMYDPDPLSRAFRNLL